MHLSNIFALDLFAGPLIIGFELDKNYGKIVLDFDQIVVADSFNISRFTLQASPSVEADSDVFAMYDAVFNNLTEQGNTTSLIIYISTNDFARLALEPVIGVVKSTTYAALGVHAVRSPFGRYNGAQSLTNAVAATSFLRDESPVYVTDFQIDMENKEISFNFSEPVNPDSLDVSGLALQNKPNVFSSGTYVALSGAGAAIVSVDNYQRRISISLGRYNYNLINEGIDLCTKLENCFASASAPFVKDVSGNAVSVEGFNENFGMPCTNYSRDTTPPYLLYWELNLGRGEVNIVFSEPVHMPFFNYSAVVICNNETLNKSSIVMRVKWPLKYYFENTHFVNFTLIPEQVNYLKQMDHVATAMNDTFLVLEPNVVTDTARLANPYLGIDATPEAPRQVRKVHQDIQDPEVIHAVLDMQTWHLRLQFSEIVDVSSIDLREIALMSARSIKRDTEVLYFADPSSSDRVSPNIATLRETADSTVLHIDFTNITITKLKNMQFLGHSIENTYFALTYKFIKDLNENTVRTIYYSLAQRIDEFYPDTVSPRLVSWDVDLTLDLIVLLFSEPMNISSIDFSQLLLSSDGALTRETATLSPVRGSFVANTLIIDEIFKVRLRLSFEDMNELKKKLSPRLCSSLSDCYLSLTAGFAVDTISVSGTGEIVQNKLEPYGPARSSSFREDMQSPRLLYFTMDMLHGTLKMVFSEPIMISTVNTTGISLYPSQYQSNEGLRLSRFSFPGEGEDTERLTIILSRDDRMRIKMTRGLALGSDVSSVWITMETTTCEDISGNAFDGTRASEYGANSTLDGLVLYRPHSLLPDTSRPRINALIWSSYDIKVYWDDVVSLPTLQEAKFFISSFESVQIVSLDGVIVSSTHDSNVLAFNIYPIAQRFTAINKIGVDQDNSNIYLQTSGAIKSVNGVSSAAIDRYAAIRDGNAVLAFHLNMGTGLLSFELAYPANFSEFIPSLLSLTRPSNSISVRLTGSQSWNVYSGKFVELVLTATDMQSIKSQRSLAEVADGLFLVVPAAALTEKIPSRRLSRQFMVPCSNLIRDTSRPQVTSFNINLGTGVMTVFFSEPILLSSVAANNFYIVSSRAESPASVVQLSQAQLLTVSTSSAGTVTSITFNLENGPHPTDRDRLHLAGLGLSASSVNLFVAAGSIADTSTPMNYLRMNSYSEAVAVSAFTADKVRPELVSFVLNMHTRKLILTFDEAVDPSTNKPNSYTIIQNPFDTTANFYQLTDSVTSASTFVGISNIVSIDLSDKDVDSMMFLYPNLATRKENSHLSVLPSAIRDISPSSNGNPEVFYLFALSVDTFYLDRTPPVLQKFDFSLDEGLLTVYFNEVMRCSMTDVSGIQFQHAAFSGSSSLTYRLQPAWSTVQPCNADYSKVIRIKIGKIEILSVKAKNLLMKSALHSYLRFTAGTFFDVNENSASPISDGRAIPVTNFIGDTTPPRMLGFSATKQGLLYLYFSEPVYRPSFNLTRIALQDDEDEHPFPLYELRTYRLMRLRDGEQYSFVARVDQLQMEYVISMQNDYLYQVHQSYIFLSQETTFLQYQATLVTDMSGNFIIPMPRSNPINVGPAIVLWNLDLNINVLTLAFTEKVSSSFSPLGILIQNAAANPSITVVLSGTVNNFRYAEAELEMYTYVEVTLAFADVMALRLSGLLDNYLSPDIYLACRLNITQAVSPASLNERPYKSTAVHVFDALPISDFWPDTLGPSCMFYNLDLNTGHIELHFSEPVDAGSLDVTKISLLSFDSGDIFKITGSRTVVLFNYTIVRIELSQIDLCYIKRAVRNALLEYMLIAEDAIKDSFGNSIRANDVSNLIAINSFEADSTPPNVEAFVYDRNDHTIELTFDEEIDISSLYPIKVWILNESIGASSEALQLSNYTIVRYDDVSPPNLPTIVILDLGLLQVDADRVDALTFAAKDITTTFIQLHEVRDIFLNKMVGTVAYPCTSFVEDTTVPQILSFDFTVNGASTDITIYFSEVMELTSFTCDDLAFSSMEDFASASDVVAISDSDCTLNSGSNSRSVSFTVLSSLFSSTSIGATLSTTWVYVASAAPLSSDIAGIALEPSSLAIRVGPHSSDFFVDMQRGVVTIVFSKDVNTAGTVTTEGFGFYTLGSGRSIQLSSGIDGPALAGYRQSAVGLDTVLELTLSPTDVNWLKSIVPLTGDLYLTVAEDTIFDDNGVSIAPVIEDDLLLALDVIPDTVRPILLSAIYNMSSDTVVLTFDEPILLSSVSIPKLVLQSLGTSDAEHIQLNGGTVSWGNSMGNVLVIDLTFADAVKIKIHPSIGVSVDSTYISFGIDFLTDTAGNSIVPILPTAAYKFDEILEDTVRPTLRSFDLNMNDGTLALHFSEPMRATSFDISMITLQNKYYVVQNHLIEGTVYQLTGGDVSNIDSPDIIVYLSNEDLLGIKNSWNLARLRSSSYLLIQPAAAQDIAGNEVIEIRNGNAMLCSEFFKDVTRPNVTSVSLDYNTGTLTFVFIEPIFLDTVNPSQVTVFKNSDDSLSDGSNYFTLTTSTVVLKPFTHPLSEVVSLILSRSDLNNIRSRYPLGYSTRTTLITASELFCEDTSGNNMWPIEHWVLDLLAKDITPPFLEAYALDMSLPLPMITLTFSEAIDPLTVNARDCVVQNYPERRFGHHVNMARTTVNVGTGALSNTLFIHIDFDTANEMKLNRIGQFADSGSQVAKSGLLSWGKEFLKDYSGNYILPVYDRSIPGTANNPIVPSEFHADDLAPILYMWFFEDASETIFMRFSESVEITKVTALSIILYDDFGFSSGVYPVPSSANLSYSLSFGSTVQIFDLGDDMLNALRDRNTATATYLYVNSSGIRDRANAPNYLPLIEMKSEGAPICDVPCPDGQYESKQCTASEDRVCSACSICKQGEYQFASCSARADTKCTGLFELFFNVHHSYFLIFTYFY